jgi:HEAT repeat protein
LALEDADTDILNSLIRTLSCSTASLNQKVFKSILPLMGSEVEGTRSLASAWISRVLTITQERLRQEWAYALVIVLLTNGQGLVQLSAAGVIAKVVSHGNLKYLKDVLPLLEHERALTRVAGVYALQEAVKNVVPSVMWSSSGGPTVPRCLQDVDRRVRLAAIAVLGEAPEGTSTASAPLLRVLEDDDREVRNAAADVLANILARNDVKHKLTLVRTVAINSTGQAAIGAGCDVGAKYMSLEVGYIGKRRRLEQEVRAAAIRAIRKMGVPDDIVRLGVKAMEVAIERHSLGYKYELPPTFYEENGLNLDGTPTNTLAPRA